MAGVEEIAILHGENRRDVGIGRPDAGPTDDVAFDVEDVLGDDLVQFVRGDHRFGPAHRLDVGDAASLAQQECAGLAVEQADADDFIVVIDAAGVGEDPSGSGIDQIVQVEHDAVSPEECLVGAGRHVGATHDPRSVVDGPGP